MAKIVPVVKLAAHAKCSTLYGRSYGRTVGRTVERSYVHIFRLDGLLLFRIIMGLRCALHYNFFIFFKHSFTYAYREQYTVVKAILF